MSRLLALLLLIAAPAAAQVRPEPGTGDPHLQSVDYDPQRIVQLSAAPGYEMMVELSPDEQVQTVALGDASGWQVNVSHSGDHLFVKPNPGSAPTNMAVVTSVRVYNFELEPLISPGPDTPFTVTFHYPEAVQPAGTADQGYVDLTPLKRSLSRYKLSGDKWLRPDSITDDGTHTYIQWAENKPIPAVFEINQSGAEVLANGEMRGDTYVVDDVAGELTFRIDKRRAEAVRLPPKALR